MGKSTVSFSHTMYLFSFFYGPTLAIQNIQKFAGQFLMHVFFTTISGTFNKPLHTQRYFAFSTHFHGDLIVGPTHTTGTNFQDGLYIFQGLLEQSQTIFLIFLGLNKIQGTIKNLFSNIFFAVPHKLVDKLGHGFVFKLWIRSYLPFNGCTFSRHISLKKSGSRNQDSE